MRIFSTLLLLVTCLSALAQNNPATSSDIIQPRTTPTRKAAPPTTPPANQPTAGTAGTAKSAPTRYVIPAFPKTWQGKWKGTLTSFTVPNRMQRTPMTLEILATPDTTRYVFAVTYGSDSIKNRRAYELLVLDAKRGLYQIDQKNSIKLESFFAANRLLSGYTIQGVRVMTSYERRGENMIFDVVSGRDAYIAASGGGKPAEAPAEAKNLPVVQTYPIGQWQRAVLTRVSKPDANASAKTTATPTKTPAKPGRKL